MSVLDQEMLVHLQFPQPVSCVAGGSGGAGEAQPVQSATDKEVAALGKTEGGHFSITNIIVADIQL